MSAETGMSECRAATCEKINDRYISHEVGHARTIRTTASFKMGSETLKGDGDVMGHVRLVQLDLVNSARVIATQISVYQTGSLTSTESVCRICGTRHVM